MNSRFIFKAHGSLDDEYSLVLTGDSYRALFNEYPYYETFMQYIFTNFQLVIVGFCLSEPDFDMFLQDVFSIVGFPIQEHVVIKHISQKKTRDTFLRLRFGLNFLYVDEFKDIPVIFKECIKASRYILGRILDDCISKDIKIRGRSYSYVRNLSDIGKNCLGAILEEKINANIKKQLDNDYSLNTETSEYVYTYGVIASSMKTERYKEFLSENVIEVSEFSEPVAHALFILGIY